MSSGTIVVYAITDAYLDFLGSVCVLEAVVGVLVSEVGRRHVGDHDRSTVASDRVLQEPGQLGVPVGDVLRAVGQGVDAVA